MESMLLFAQKGPPPEAAAAVAGVVIVAWICLYAVIFIAAISWAIFVYVSLYNALNAVSPRNRDMEPAAIFLMLIPCFGPIWYFFVVIRIGSSLRKEYEDRGLEASGDFGQLLGILAPIIPCVGPILMIVYIFTIRGYTARLAREGGGGRRTSRDDDDDDSDDGRGRR